MSMVLVVNRLSQPKGNSKAVTAGRDRQMIGRLMVKPDGGESL